ncbi:MAG: DNA repair protein RecN [Candidatus Cryptobacteroides sp.]
MLTSLQVRNYVLIDSLDIQFPAGLGIITGQTGAGKSILLGALSLVLGSKADASLIGRSADNCIVEAAFDVRDDKVLEGMLAEKDLPWNGGQLVVRRVVAASGRSRSFINDEPVKVEDLARFASRLVDIHSQHQTLLLSDRAYQLSMLDHFAGNSALLEECSGAWTALSSHQAELSSIEERIRTLAQQRDFNEAMFRRLDEARLREGEMEELDLEQKALANAEEIKSGLYSVSGAFSGDPQTDSPSVDSMMKEAVRQLSKVAKYVPDASGLASRLDSARLEIEDILAEVESLGQRTEVSPERLEAVENRMSLLYELMKKHQCADIAQLIAERDRLSGLIFDSDALSEKRDSLVKTVGADRERLDRVCKALHDSREKAAGPFAAEIQQSIRDLELDQAVFRVEVTPSAVSRTGADAVSFLFSASGVAPVDVAKCASGGEMSRIMLCLKAMMAKYTSMPTMVFDEIDTGVSGSVADKMGSMICRMGKDMQVFAITHLPQVAAKGNAHFLVSKSISEDGRAVTSISPLTGQERVREIARMLSGSTITPEAIANAKSLLSN